MDYEKAYKELKLEIIGTAKGYRRYLKEYTEFEYLKTYIDTVAQVKTLERLEELINKQK